MKEGTEEKKVDRVFIYIHGTPKGIKFLVSRDLASYGGRVHRINASDPMAEAAEITSRTLIDLLKRKGYGGRGGLVPRLAAVVEVLPEAERYVRSWCKMTYLPRNSGTADRIILESV